MGKPEPAGANGPLEERRRLLLEEALSYVMPRAQAGAAAETLIGRFGGMEGMMLPPQAELQAVVGEAAGRYLGLTLRLAALYLEDRSDAVCRVYDTATALELLRPKFLGRTNEAVAMLLLDGRGRLLFNDVLLEGSVSAVPIYLRRLVELCLHYGAQNVLLAHNHPSGNPLPSQNDVMATRQLQMALECMEVDLNDHIILAGEDHFSFLQSGGLAAIKRESQRILRQVIERGRKEEAPALRPWDEASWEPLDAWDPPVDKLGDL